jgi:hypothetical protein
LTGAVLRGTDLTGADLRRADLTGALLTVTKFEQCGCGSTNFGDVDLSQAEGLETTRHRGPSVVGVDTLFQSKSRIPEAFLRGCGVPDARIQYLPLILGATAPIQFYSCFISHSTADKDFARRLHSRTRDEGLRVWFDAEDIKGGRELHTQIDEAIRVYEKLLLVLSEASMTSKWVKPELRRARLAEQRVGVRKLFPIRLVPYEVVAAWSVPDSSGGTWPRRCGSSTSPTSAAGRTTTPSKRSSVGCCGT